MAERFQVLAPAHPSRGDVSGAQWIIAASDDPAKAFAELEAFAPEHQRMMVVWDDQRDEQVTDLDEALGNLEEEASEAEVFKGFTNADAEREGQTHSGLDAKVRTRKGEG